MHAPRLLWLYNHLVARYQEVSLFVDLGFEVIIAFDELPQCQDEYGYHDETHPLYPKWRRNVSLPSGIVERLRRLPIYESLGRLSPDEMDLVNKHVDVIYIGGYPEVAENLTQWFTGLLIYRLMGFVNPDAQEGDFAHLDRVASTAGRKFILAPGYANLISAERPCARTMCVYNGWVDESRINAVWAHTQSDPYVATAISYLHFHPVFQRQFTAVKTALTNYPFLVVGKTDLNACHFSDSRILGMVAEADLHRYMTSARAFIDAGDCPTHLVWPPVEAAYMGVPVLFTCKSGLVGPSLAYGIDERYLRRAGMFDRLEDIDRFLCRYGHDFEALSDIAALQSQMWVRGVFSRNRARDALSPLWEAALATAVRRVNERPIAIPSHIEDTDSAKAFCAVQGSRGFRWCFASKAWDILEMPRFLPEHNIWIAPGSGAAIGRLHMHPSPALIPTLRWTSARTGTAIVAGCASPQGRHEGEVHLVIRHDSVQIASIRLKCGDWRRFVFAIPVKNKESIDLGIILDGEASDSAKTWFGANIFIM